MPTAFDAQKALTEAIPVPVYAARKPLDKLERLRDIPVGLVYCESERLTISSSDHPNQDLGGELWNTSGIYGAEILDGLGATQNPLIAAGIAGTRIASYLHNLPENLTIGQITTRFMDAFVQADHDILAYNQSQPQNMRESLTTGLAGVLVRQPDNSMLFINANVGNSRFVIFDKHGNARVATEDHNVAWRLYQEGKINNLQYQQIQEAILNNYFIDDNDGRQVPLYSYDNLIAMTLQNCVVSNGGSPENPWLYLDDHPELIEQIVTRLRRSLQDQKFTNAQLYAMTIAHRPILAKVENVLGRGYTEPDIAAVRVNESDTIVGFSDGVNMPIGVMEEVFREHGGNLHAFNQAMVEMARRYQHDDATIVSFRPRQIAA